MQLIAACGNKLDPSKFRFVIDCTASTIDVKYNHNWLHITKTEDMIYLIFPYHCTSQLPTFSPSRPYCPPSSVLFPLSSSPFASQLPTFSPSRPYCPLSFSHSTFDVGLRLRFQPVGLTGRRVELTAWRDVRCSMFIFFTNLLLFLPSYLLIF